MSRDPVRDIVRALTVLEMEMVETHGDFDHAEIEDKTVTFADTVFPTFSFLSGMSHVPWRRSASLASMGIIFNALEVFGPHKEKRLRVLGVLQRHALSLVLYNYLPQNYLTLGAVVSTWLAISIGLSDTPEDPFGKPENTAQTKIDNFIFGDSLYRKEYDPEGLLGALGTYITVFFGAEFSKHMGCPFSEALCGTGFIGAGYLLSMALPKYLPVSKPLWTPTFALITSGVAMLKFATVRLALPFLPSVVVKTLGYVGRNSIPLYFAGHLIRLLVCQRKPWIYVKNWLTENLPFGSYSAAGSELIMTSVMEASLIGLASYLATNNIRVKV